MAYVAIADRDHEQHLHDPQSFVAKYVWSQDHKVIAIQYGVIAILVGLVALVLSGMMRLQLAWPNEFAFIMPAAYYQFITMHGMIMVIYLLTALFLGGFGNYLIPLMVGARDMVFPFMNMLSVWVYLLAVLILMASFFVPGGPTGAGWTLYPPQAILEGTPGAGLGHHADARLARRIHRGLHDGRIELRDHGPAGARARHDADAHAAERLGHFHGDRARPARLPGAAGQRHHDDAGPAHRHQLSSCRRSCRWAISSTMKGAARSCSSTCSGSSAIRKSISSRCRLSASSPILLSTHARKNIFGYRMMVWAIVAIGALSFIVWAHHMYVSGMNPYFGFFFATTTLIIAVPTAIKVYNWVLTLWQGDIHLTTPMLFAIGFIFTFIHGGLTGLFLGNVVVDLPLVRHLLRRRPLPYGHGRLADSRRARRDLSLVSEDDREDAERNSAQFISGVRSSAPIRFTCRCITWAFWACRDATTRWARPIS